MCLKIKLKSALKNALSFSLDPRRISVMFSVIAITSFAIFVSLISFISYLPTDTEPFVKMAEIVPNYAGKILLILVLFAAILSLSAILSILMKGAFIQNYAIRGSKEATMKKSIDALNGKIMPLIKITALIFLISIVLDSIKYLGAILGLLFSFVVFFAYQEIIIAKKSAMDSIKGSYIMFWDSWREIIVSITAIIAVTMVIITLFSMPFFVVLFSTIAQIPEMPVTYGLFISEFASAAQKNVLPFIVSGAILAVGIAISNIFSNGFTTDVYLQLKGEKTETVQNGAADQKTIIAAKKIEKPAAKRKIAKKKSGKSSKKKK